MKLKRAAFALPLVLFFILLCGFLLTAIATTFGTYTIWQRQIEKQIQNRYTIQASADRLLKRQNNDPSIVTDTWELTLSSQSLSQNVQATAVVDNRTPDDFTVQVALKISR